MPLTCVTSDLVSGITDSEGECGDPCDQSTQSSWQDDCGRTAESDEQEAIPATSNVLTEYDAQKEFREQYSMYVLENRGVHQYEFKHVQVQSLNLLPWTQHSGVKRQDHQHSTDFILKNCTYCLPGTQSRSSTNTIQCQREAVSAMGIITRPAEGRKGAKLQKIVGSCRFHRQSMIADGLQVLTICGVSGIPAVSSDVAGTEPPAQTDSQMNCQQDTNDRHTLHTVNSSHDIKEHYCHWLSSLLDLRLSHTLRFCSSAHSKAFFGKQSSVIPGWNQPQSHRQDMYYVPNRQAYSRSKPDFRPITRLAVPAEHLKNVNMSMSVDPSVDFYTDEHGKYTTFWIKPEKIWENKISDSSISEVTDPELLIRVYRDTSEEHKMVLHSISSTCSSEVVPHKAEQTAHPHSVQTGLFHPASQCASRGCENIAFRAQHTGMHRSLVEYCEYHYFKMRSSKGVKQSHE